jgi:hypothetical protein
MLAVELGRRFVRTPTDWQQVRLRAIYPPVDDDPTADPEDDEIEDTGIWMGAHHD